jgi:hypothetical protein
MKKLLRMRYISVQVNSNEIRATPRGNLTIVDPSTRIGFPIIRGNARRVNYEMAG